MKDLDAAAALTPGSARALASAHTFPLPFPAWTAPAATATPGRPAAEIPGLTLLPARLAKARACILAARWREAADAYAQVLVTTPDSLEALAEHALACNHAGEGARARADAVRVLQLQPTSLRDYYFKAVACDAAQRHDEAALAARLAEALEPRDDFDLWVRGRAHLFQEHYPQADADFAALLRDQPPTAMAFLRFNRGRAGSGMKRYEQALEAYGEALQIAPGFRDAYLQRAEVYRAVGRLAEAAADETAAQNLPAP